MVRSFSWPGLIDCKLIILIVNYGKFAAEYRVERFFQKIKRFRRIATRYDKTARMYLTGVMFVSILLALK